MSNMSDENRELVSALMDGEASEIEIHKLLRQYKQDTESGAANGIRDTLLVYGRIISTIGGPAGANKPLDLSQAQHQRLHQAISQAIDEDETVFDAGVLPKPSILIHSKPFQAAALAACLVVAVGLGVSVFDQSSSDGAQTRVASSGLQAGESDVVNAQPVSASSAEQELRELDEERQRELRAYLNRHDRAARRDPNVQTVGTGNARNKED